MESNSWRWTSSGPLGNAAAAVAIVFLVVMSAPLTAMAQPEADASALILLCDTQTSAADFTAGAGFGTMVSELDNGLTAGQVRLQAPLNDLFLGPDLGPLWQTTLPGIGYTPVITDGILDVQERNDTVYETSALESVQAYEAGVVMEMRASIEPGSAFVSLGFNSSTADPGQWAYFGTRGTGDGVFPVIYTSVRDASLSMVNVPTNISLGEEHVFRIVWLPGVLEFWVDGVMVDSRTGVSMTMPQHVGMYKSSGSASALPVDWVRVTPYNATIGTYESSVRDAGTAAVDWTTLGWTGTVPAGATLAFETRSGETASPDPTWSAWTGLVGSGIASPVGRYLQFRATLSTTDSLESPVIDDVTVCYTLVDVTPPQVASVSPPDGSTDIVSGSAVSATFDEAIDPATVDATSFTLEVQGGAVVPAVVAYDSTSFTATLMPTADLDFSTAYVARLATSITDLDGNALAVAEVWSFTTMAQDLIPPTVTVVDPADGAMGILASRPVTATFSEAIEPSTLDGTSFTLTPQGGSPVPAIISYDAGQFTATLDPVDDLHYSTVYEVRLTGAVTDRAGNPLAADEVWTFTTRLAEPLCALATTRTDFATGQPAGTMVSEVDNGELSGQLRLQAPMSDMFLGSALEPIWVATSPVGYSPVIADGILDVQQREGSTDDVSSIETQQAWGPGMVLEARAKFNTGSRFIDVGFDSGTENNTQYAWFSTAGTGDQPGLERITARVRQYDHTTNAIDTGATFGEWHIFKIVWTYGQADFYVDGVLVASHEDILMAYPMRAAFYKSNDSDTSFEIDWIRLTPYLGSPGTYDSPVVDTGTPGNSWASLDWQGSVPAGTSVAFETRTGETSSPDGGWSPWVLLNENHIVSPPGRYGQYRAMLASDDLQRSPAIDEIRFCYDPPSDSTPPAVAETLPPDGAVGVAATAPVTVRFNKALDAATVTTASFTLTPDGGSAVPATVSWDPLLFVATLQPDTLLDYETLYTGHLAATIADTVGNLLPAAYDWSFTTAAAPDTAAPTVLATMPADGATDVPADGPVTVTFSEPVDPATVTTASFLLVPDGGSAVPATVATDSTGALATLLPDTLLAYETHYTATLTTAVTDTFGNGLAAQYAWGFATGVAPPDTLGPIVLSTTPVAAAVGVAADAVVTAAFDEPVAAATLTGVSFTLTPEGGAAVPATVAYDSVGALATLTPDTLLALATVYTARLTTAVTDTLGNPLAADHAWSFTTVAPPDTIAPTVLTVAPVADAVAVPVGTTVSAGFDEAMDPATLTDLTFTLTPAGGSPVAASVVYAPADSSAILAPSLPLAFGTVYEARLGSAVADLAGNGLVADVVWSFTTETADLTPPIVTGTDPMPGATEVLVGSVVRATFSEAVAPATLTAASFTLTRQGSAAVAAVVNYDDPTRTATLVPTADLEYAATYEARLTTAVTDLAGNPLAGDEVWTFTTRLEAPSCTITTSTTDFAAGILDGVQVGESDNGSVGGQLRLQATRSDLFLVPALDSTWQVTRPSPTFVPVITDGILDGQERDDEVYLTSAMQMIATYGAGVACEMRAMIQPGSAFSSLGFFSSTYQLDQWAFFSTRGTGDDPVPVIHTSVRGSNSAIIDVPTSITLDQWHDFKVVWLPGSVEFYVDGALVDIRTSVDITLPQRFGYYKSAGSASGLLIDWVRITPYTGTIGDYESVVQDSGEAGAAWTELAAFGTTPAGTSVDYETRTGETALPDGSWSAWAPAAGGVVTSPPGRYAQFRAALATGDPMTSPVIDGIQFCFETAGTVPDTTAPMVVATVPAANAAGVAIDVPVSATFSEPLDPATVTATSFTLVPDGGSALLATVSLDSVGTTAILNPDVALVHSTVYSAHLSTAITDTSGVAMAAEYVWSFTTAAEPDTTRPIVLSTLPVPDMVNVPVDTVVVAVFSEPIDRATLTTATFTLVPEGGSPVPATVSYDSVSFTATLVPDAPLAIRTVYTATLTAAITDTTGLALVVDHVWTFTTVQGLSAVDGAELPAITALQSNYPNPFNPRTTVAFDLARSGSVRLRVYSVDGRLVRTLLSESMPAGRHSVVWNGDDDSGRSVATGVYLLRMETPDLAQTRKMLLMQ